MSETLTEFVQKFLTTLGLTGDDVDVYTNKVLLTAMGKAMFALDLSDAEKSALEREMEHAQEHPEGVIGALDRALPDERHVALFGSMVSESLMELADSLKDSLNEETAQKLAALVDEFAA